MGVRARHHTKMSAALRVKKDFTTKGGDGSVDWELLKRKLSSFQIEKLTYFFHQFFDNDHNGVINADDFTGLNETLRQLAGWQKDDPKFIAMVDNPRVFLECFWTKEELSWMLRVWSHAPGRRLWPQARWSSTLSLSIPGCSCGPSFAMAPQELMTSQSGSNLFP